MRFLVSYNLRLFLLSHLRKCGSNFFLAKEFQTVIDQHRGMSKKPSLLLLLLLFFTCPFSSENSIFASLLEIVEFVKTQTVTGSVELIYSEHTFYPFYFWFPVT